MKTRLIFIIQGYTDTNSQGNLTDVCTIELIDKNAESALERAGELIPKAHYRVSSIIEQPVK